MTPVYTAEESAERWEAVRGQKVAIDLGTFKKGECANCDSWLVAGTDYRKGLCVTRGHVEVGD